jgi:hypothetical protein
MAQYKTGFGWIRVMIVYFLLALLFHACDLLSDYLGT